jgi:hypothetical protein
VLLYAPHITHAHQRGQALIVLERDDETWIFVITDHTMHDTWHPITTTLKLGVKLFDRYQRF